MNEKNEKGNFFDDETLSLSDIVAPVRKNLTAIILTAVAGGLIGAAYCYIVPPVYEAKAYMQLGSHGGAPLESVGQISTIMTAPDNVLRIKSELLKSGMDEKHIAISVGTLIFTEESDMLKIMAQAGDGEKAVAVVAAVIKVLSERHSALYAAAEIQLQKTTRVVRENIRPVPLSAGISELTIVPSVVKVAPYAGAAPVWPKKSFVISSSFISGGILAVLVALLAEKIIASR